MGVDAADAVRFVLGSWGRRAVLIRRFDHGVGGTSLIAIDGSSCVLKAWRLGSVHAEHRLEESLRLADRMRDRGVPVPVLIDRGQVDGHGYLLYEFLDGEWSQDLGSEAVQDLLAVIGAARGAAPSPNPGWAQELDTMLTTGDASFDIAPAVLESSAAVGGVLTEARRRLAACDPATFRTGDVVHGDFAPENLLLRNGRVVGVVDWERARVGDSGLDLVGAIFDVEIGAKAEPPLRHALWRAAHDHLTDRTMAAYVGIYAVRYLSWAVDTEMEREVMDLARRMLRQSHVAP